ncbi:MAG TPA: ATP synthase F0 subunit B [Bryobacteraceae bacterium]|jgi:F-type H+-transporting ATPase subunit b|nr:ATP synthase F0 subunit B [Bryobacteraceae bacterium]
MQTTLHALVGLLIKSTPTIFFFILLTLYLKRVYFKPLAKVLEERKKATEGVREIARHASEAADKKTSEFEHALQIARAELHQEHEALRQRWAQEQAEAIARTRAEADHQIEDAKRQIRQELERAQAEAETHVGELSEQIVNSLLRRRAA